MITFANHTQKLPNAIGIVKGAEGVGYCIQPILYETFANSIGKT